MRMPPTMTMENVDKLRDEETKKLIKNLQETIAELVAIIYGDMKEVEERLNAGGL